MSELRTTALTIDAQQPRPWTAVVTQAVSHTVVQTGNWAVNTAQHFASLLSALMGPFVVSAYAFAVWSLAADLGWTSTFPYSIGPLSNWLIWAGIAVAVHLASDVLRRHTQADK